MVDSFSRVCLGAERPESGVSASHQVILGTPAGFFACNKEDAHTRAQRRRKARTCNRGELELSLPSPPAQSTSVLALKLLLLPFANDSSLYKLLVEEAHDFWIERLARTYKRLSRAFYFRCHTPQDETGRNAIH